MNSLKVFVTGSSGFIGTNLVDFLLDNGNSVLGVDLVGPKHNKHKENFLRVDLLNIKSLRDAVENFSPNIVFHLGAKTDLDGESISSYNANHDGTRNLIEVLSNCRSVTKAIFASTRLVNPIGYQPKSFEDYCPTTFYGESKVLGEKIIRKSGSMSFEWAIVRPTSIWGPWFGVPYRNFFDAALAGHYVHPSGKRVRKSFGYVGNAVFELIKLMEAPAGAISTSTYYLADYDPIEVFEFSSEIVRQAKRGAVREVPLSVLKMGALIGDAAKVVGWREPPLTSFRLNNLITEMIYDTDNLKGITGPLPYNFRSGIQQTLSWLDSHP